MPIATTDLIGFTQAGTGAVERSAESKLRETVSVKDFSATPNATTIKDALDVADVLWIPPDVTITATGSHNLRAGTTLINDGVIQGDVNFKPLGNFNLFGNGLFRSTGWGADGKYFEFIEGDIVVRDVRWLTTGGFDRYALYFAPNANDMTLNVDNIKVDGERWGILRNPSVGKLTRYRVVNSTFLNITGDAVQFNIIPEDRNGFISDNIIINVVGSVTNSGMGIGLAGNAADTSVNDYDTLTQDCVIQNNLIIGANEPIHVEFCNKVTITGNTVEDAAKVSTSNLTGSGIVVYGGRGHLISGNDIVGAESYGIRAAMGVISPNFSHSCQDIIIKGNVVVDTKGILVQSPQYTGDVGRYSTVVDNTVDGGAIELFGAAQWTIEDNTVSAAAVSATVTVADDAVATLNLGVRYGVIVKVSDGTSTVHYSGDTKGTVASQRVYAVGSTGWNVTTGVLAGTTGTDGAITGSLHSDGKFYLENRSGGEKTFTLNYAPAALNIDFVATNFGAAWQVDSGAFLKISNNTACDKWGNPSFSIKNADVQISVSGGGNNFTCVAGSPSMAIPARPAYETGTSPALPVWRELYQDVYAADGTWKGAVTAEGRLLIASDFYANTDASANVGVLRSSSKSWNSGVNRREGERARLSNSGAGTRIPIICTNGRLDGGFYKITCIDPATDAPLDLTPYAASGSVLSVVDAAITQTGVLPLTVASAAAGDGNTTLVTAMEFGKKYHVKVEETTAFNGTTNKDFKLGTAAGDASFLAAVTATGTAVGYAEISGTENVGANIVLSWLNNATPTTGQLTATVKVVG